MSTNVDTNRRHDVEVVTPEMLARLDALEESMAARIEQVRDLLADVRTMTEGQA